MRLAATSIILAFAVSLAGGCARDADQLQAGIPPPRLLAMATLHANRGLPEIMPE
jgi:hypothetical protein